MNEAQAHALAEFVKDHDKRFAAKARPDGDHSIVHLTRVSDGTTLPPVTDWVEYQRAYIDGDDPGPTVREEWDTWLLGQASLE